MRLITSMCSGTSRVADSPVVPTATMALVPSCRWKSTSLLRLSQSRPPCASMGVTSADVGKPTFREEKFKEYKINRLPMPNDLKSQIPLIREIISAYNIKAVQKEGYEADD